MSRNPAQAKSLNHIRSKTYMVNAPNIQQTPSETSFLPSINMTTPRVSSKMSIGSNFKNSLNIEVRKREVNKIEHENNLMLKRI